MAAPPSVLTGRSRGVAHGGMNLVESVPGAVKSRPISYECPNIFPYLPRSPHRVISSGSHCGARRDGTPGPGAVLLHPPTNSDGARRHRGSRVPRAWQKPASTDTIQARADTRGVHGCALSETVFPWPWSSAVAANAPSRIAYEALRLPLDYRHSDRGGYTIAASNSIGAVPRTHGGPSLEPIHVHRELGEAVLEHARVHRHVPALE